MANTLDGKAKCLSVLEAMFDESSEYFWWTPPSRIFLVL